MLYYIISLSTYMNFKIILLAFAQLATRVNTRVSVHSQQNAMDQLASQVPEKRHKCLHH